LAETCHAPHAGCHLLAGLDVAVSYDGPGRLNADGDERFVRGRGRSRGAKSLAKAFVVSDRPVGVHAEHDRVLPSKFPHAKCRKGERGGRACRLWLGNHLLVRHQLRTRPHPFCKLCVREHERALLAHERSEATQCFIEQRTIAHQGQQLLGPGRGAERPEARAHTSRKHNHPQVHRECPSFSGPMPASCAVRSYRRRGLNGFVMKSSAPSSIARLCCSSWPAAVRMMQGMSRNRSFDRMCDRTSRPLRSGIIRSSRTRSTWSSSRSSTLIASSPSYTRLTR